MKFNLYSVRDHKGTFGVPTMASNDDAAERNFAYEFSHADGLPAFAIDDFDLYRIGTFDIDVGLLESEAVPVMITSGRSAFNKYGVSVKGES